MKQDLENKIKEGSFFLKRVFSEYSPKICNLPSSDTCTCDCEGEEALATFTVEAVASLIVKYSK